MNTIFEQSQKSFVNPEDLEQKKCRICYEVSRPLISVCACSGSIAYVHEDCILDWISKKIQTADRVQIPECEVCHEKFSAKLKIGKKKLSPKLLIEKILNLQKKDQILLVIHTIVFFLALIQLAFFFYSSLAGKILQNLVLTEMLKTIFTNFVCQIYVIFFFSAMLKEKRWMLNQSMVQIVQVTLRPKILLRK